MLWCPQTTYKCNGVTLFLKKHFYIYILNMRSFILMFFFKHFYNFQTKEALKVEVCFMSASKNQSRFEFRPIRKQYFYVLTWREKETFKQTFLFITLQTHPCNENMVFPVKFFSQGKTCFHYKEPCTHCRDPVFITGISL